MTDLEAAAKAALEDRWGSGVAPVTGRAPGRCTLVGEHVDYADGVVACLAVDRAVAVALRPSGDGRWRLRSGARAVERDRPDPAGDAGDRVFAVALALGAAAGIEAPPVEVTVAADLPESAGLSSSAALACATEVAMLRLTGARLPARALAEVALVAERDVVGVPCGPLDQRAVVDSRAGHVLLLDCRSGAAELIPWGLEDQVLVVCHTGDAHDVAGAGYRDRRRQADAALRLLGAASYRDVDAAALARTALPEPEGRRARHIVTETARALESAAALRAGDARGLGRLMHESHVSLRDDYDVSTPALDAAVATAEAVPGCHGARLVGAGFGGSTVALVDAGAAEAVRAAMAAAAGGGGRGSWVVRPADGVAAACPDVVA